ncbi:GSCOCT00014285001.2-RA-CDS [Cotesia congregata]|uniref:Cc_bv9.1_29.11_pseudo n=1 Tax=Cotesia congregata TaxID=51543 RepID=A0A8J2HDG0_COTCN|nr:GSCOCT00014285001.2-RA-CDS [Cotesia congregata]CAG5092418.1 cc_bv9.1_29.11_pseudo [Cotesia congregata]
MIAAKNFVWSF